jgi:hypothetical protein
MGVGMGRRTEVAHEGEQAQLEGGREWRRSQLRRQALPAKQRALGLSGKGGSGVVLTCGGKLVSRLSVRMSHSIDCGRGVEIVSS